MHWAYLIVGLLVGYTIAQMHFESFFGRLLFQRDVYRIDISITEGRFEVALHHGKKKRLVNRVICKSVREGLIKHLKEDRSKP